MAVKQTFISKLFYRHSLYCAVPENIHTHSWNVNGNSKGRDVSKAKILKGNYGAYLIVGNFARDN